MRETIRLKSTHSLTHPKSTNHEKVSFYSLLAVLSVSLSSCELIGDIFKAGMWTGVIAVVVVVALVIFLISRLFGGR